MCDMSLFREREGERQRESERERERERERARARERESSVRGWVCIRGRVRDHPHGYIEALVKQCERERTHTMENTFYYTSRPL